MISSQMVQYTSVRRCAKLLCLELLLASANGDTQRAVESVMASRALVESLNDRSLLIAYLIGRGCLGITIANLEQALSRTTFTQSQLAELSTAFRESDGANGFAHVLIGERAFADEEWDDIRKGKVLLTDLTHWNEDTNGILDLVVAVIYRPSGLIDLDYSAYLDLSADFIRTSTIAFPQRFEQIDSIKRKVEHLRVCPLTQMYADTLVISARRDARIIAQLGAACASLGIERFRLANGTLPDSLGDLTPTFLNSVPTDPFNGQPLRYKKMAKGYVVYSVGEDGVDNDGTEGFCPGTDITFTVER